MFNHLTNSASARKGRAMETMSAKPSASSVSASSGVLMRLLATTGIFSSARIALVSQAKAARGTLVAMVGNPQMKALEQLKGEFEAAPPEIKLNLLILPENEIRAKVTTDVATGAGTFDLITVGMYEVPLWAKQGWIDEVGTTLDADPAYDSADFFQSIRDGLSFEGKLYAAPFYGESSSLFYRKDLFAAAGADRLPTPCWPAGLRLTPREGAGEAQTPLIGPGAARLAVGDRVWFRHPKAGEICERTDVLQVVSGTEHLGAVPTYRGEGQAFL